MLHLLSAPALPALLLPARLLTSPLPCLPGCSPRGDDLDTRLLRAMVVKGMLEQITTSQVGAAGRPDCWVPSAGCRVLGAAGRAVLGLPALTRAEGLELRAACLGHGPPPQSAPGHLLPSFDRALPHLAAAAAARLQVNLVNADLLAKKRGLRIVETVVPAEGTAVLSEIEVGGWVGGWWCDWVGGWVRGPAVAACSYFAGPVLGCLQLRACLPPSQHCSSSSTLSF